MCHILQGLRLKIPVQSDGMVWAQAQMPSPTIPTDAWCFPQGFNAYLTCATSSTIEVVLSDCFIFCLAGVLNPKSEECLFLFSHCVVIVV